MRTAPCITLIAVLGLGLGLFPKQKPREPRGQEYVYEQITQLTGNAPGLGWLLPDGTVAAASQASEIAVYSTVGTIETAQRTATLSSPETLAFIAKNRVACDLPLEPNPPKLSLYRSTLRPNDGASQVMFTNKAMAGARVGFRKGSLSNRIGDKVWRAMRAESPGQLRRAVVIRQPGTPYFYSIAALYGGPEQEIKRYGIFLHKTDGQIVAKDVNDIEGWCDGCEVPKHSDGIDVVFPVLNFYSLPQLKYPVLLVDTSTVEGRSLTLATFTPDGIYSCHLFYEYVVNCGG